VSLAATGGIHSAKDLLKVLLAGADVGMVASVLYHRGDGVIEELLSGLKSWLDQSDFHSIEQLKGTLSQKNCANPDEFERALYVQAISGTTDGTL
jgi:dihydroorotate dehydrogenase (fumarate)